jgi:hypothetical protein
MFGLDVEEIFSLEIFGEIFLDFRRIFLDLMKF